MHSLSSAACFADWLTANSPFRVLITCRLSPVTLPFDPDFDPQVNSNMLLRTLPKEVPEVKVPLSALLSPVCLSIVGDGKVHSMVN